MSVANALYIAQIETFRVGGPILICMGSISCILNLMVFSKGTLRKNPCTIYFIMLNVINFLYFYLGLTFTTLAVGFNIDPSTTNLTFCRFRYYMAFLLACWQYSCLILAAIDRTLFTSPNVRTRQLSTCRLVTIASSSIGLFWTLVNIHAWFYMDILQFGPGYFVCFYRPGLYNIIASYYGAVVNCMLPPLILAALGWWTVRNLTNIRAPTATSSRTADRSTTGVNRPYVVKRKDRQLIRILLVDITAFFLCKFPVAIMFIYQQITQYDEKSLDQQVIEQAVIQLTYFWYFVNNGIGCYTNIIISKTYRTELKERLVAIRLLF